MMSFSGHSRTLGKISIVENAKNRRFGIVTFPPSNKQLPHVYEAKWHPKARELRIVFFRNWQMWTDDLRRVGDFQNLVERKRYTILRFFNPDVELRSAAKAIYSHITTAVPADLLCVVNININGCPAICLDANVTEEMMLVFKNGKEIGRHLGSKPDQLEYIISKTLCGLGEVGEDSEIACLGD